MTHTRLYVSSKVKVAKDEWTEAICITWFTSHANTIGKIVAVHLVGLDQTVFRICFFSIFKKAVVRLFGFFKSGNIYIEVWRWQLSVVILLANMIWKAEMHHSAKFHQSWSIRWWDIDIFKMVAITTLDFWIRQIFIGWQSSKVRDAPLCQISTKSFNLLLRYCGFSIFQDRHQPSWIYLGYIWTTHGKYLVVSNHCATFGYDWCGSFDKDNLNISVSGAFAGNRLFDPLNWLHWQRKPKRHILSWVHIIWASSVKIWWAVCMTCRWVP